MSPKATILVVDDEPDVRDVLKDYFVSHGYAVIDAESASVAKTRAAEQAIDLALVDIHMPGEDGLSLARHLRERYPSLAIIMLTSASTVVDRIVGPRNGGRRLRAEAVRPARAGRAREERAAPHVVRGPRARSGRSVFASGVVFSTSPHIGSPTTTAARWRCRRWSSTC